ncbi:MAG: c-type cytochrome [Vulcanococcus sp.]
MVHPTSLARSGPSRRQGLLRGWIRRALILALWLAAALPAPAWADGAQLFSQHCAGCHVNGGNIIRRGKTLKLAALERQNLASPEAIAAIAAAGIGQMGGYGEVLGEAGVAEVGAWVWQQAQQGWPKPG